MTSRSAALFPPGFFDRADPSGDAGFYGVPRLVTHIDDGAIAAASALYGELGCEGRVLDLMGSWISHLPTQPRELTVLGMNQTELDANPMATATLVHDLNLDPRLPFGDAAFDLVTCSVSVDYLVDPVAVFDDVARVLEPGGIFVCTFSNRLFPTKAVRGWLMANDQQRCEIVASYFGHADGFEPAAIEVRVQAAPGVDPLYAVWSPTTTTP